jgi:[glutamine synthetase] adenylyltransferase / [glutamine synthetase]-adenylyl-L-tyrosine phosphorylase
MSSFESRVKELSGSLPDPEAAVRFFAEFVSRHPEDSAKLTAKEGLLADILTLAAFSPLLATTLLQSPEYIWWLEKRRTDTRPRSKDELLEALSRFSLSDRSTTDLLLSRFKRREFLRVFLLDIKRLVTIAETTDEISHLADSILEFALEESLSRLEKRFGKPLSDDGTGRLVKSTFTVVSLGKLGSRELNYSSDIDLLFLYSSEGETSGGESGKITNKEFFIKVSEAIIKIVGTSSGEGAAYRVDMRLRPHGRVGPLAISLSDAFRYYFDEARPWERQVLIRSRASAGDERLFKHFINSLSDSIYPAHQMPEEALRNVRLSKEKIDKEQVNAQGINVKLGIGGIREIEFIAQALQLAHGRHDKWIRAPHTIIALSRLCDRGHISDHELVSLKGAYEFLRQLEHVLQMEHGLQTHTIPEDATKQKLIALRMGLPTAVSLLSLTEKHTANVSEVFRRIFGDDAELALGRPLEETAHSLHQNEIPTTASASAFNGLMRSLRRDMLAALSARKLNELDIDLIDSLARKAPHFAERLIAMPWIFPNERWWSDENADLDITIKTMMGEALQVGSDLTSRMSSMRKTWTSLHFGIVCAEVSSHISHYESKRLQTVLAEASIENGLLVSAREVVGKNFRISEEVGVAVLGLGKLGGRGIDFGSDLDLVLVHGERPDFTAGDMTKSEVFAKIAELFVNTLSSVTRDGQIYRVDLRLRPDGKTGPMCSSASSIIDYFKQRAAIWEWLAYLKVRCSGGDSEVGGQIEGTLRRTIMDRASRETKDTLAAETSRIRERLFQERCRNLDRGTIDIKYGRGGLLDIYFASRYLQLAHGIDEEDGDRSTAHTLTRLKSIRPELSEALDIHLSAYEELSRIDHALRLSQGRSTRISLSNAHLSQLIRENFPDLEIGDARNRLPKLMETVRNAYELILTKG